MLDGRCGFVAVIAGHRRFARQKDTKPDAKRRQAPRYSSVHGYSFRFKKTNISEVRQVQLLTCQAKGLRLAGRSRRVSDRRCGLQLPVPVRFLTPARGTDVTHEASHQRNSAENQFNQERRNSPEMGGLVVTRSA